MIRRAPALLLLLSCGAPPPMQPHGAHPDEEAQLAAMAPAANQAKGEAQTRLDGALDAFFARTAPHRGYLAVDKPMYQPGETIWFQAFALASGTLSKGEERDVATVTLVNPRGAKAVEKQILIQDGSGANDFQIPPGAAGGEYILRAVTKTMTVERRVIVAAYEAPRIKKKLEFVRKAYGPGDTVTATVSLHRATGEPLASRPISGLVQLDGAELVRAPATTDAQGNAVVSFALPAQIAKGDGLLTILVDDGGITESVQKRVPIALRDLQISLLPEGGDLVAGLPGHVYFIAKNPLGKPADIEGRVTDERGTVVAQLRSLHDGMGRFALAAQPGHTYKVEIDKPAGIARTYALPAAKPSGCALHALDDFESARTDLRVAVWCTNAQTVVAAATLREARVASATVRVPDSAPAILSLPMPVGAQGAVRVTLFDDGLAPLAERLVYRDRGKDLKVKIAPTGGAHHPRESVALAIETTGPDGKPVAADLALAAVDDTVLAFADDKQANILARLYLEAELPGQKVEEPNFYFSDDKQAPAALDLVLGAQGYRRFDWKPLLAKPPAKPIDEPWAFTGDPQAPKGQRPPVRIGKAEPRAKGGKPADAVAAAEPFAVEKNAKVAPPPPPPAAAQAAPDAPKPERAKKKVAVADDDDGDADEKPMKKRKMREDDGERDEVVHVQAAAPMIDRAFGAEAEEIMIEGAAAHGAQFDNRGFDVGAEGARHHKLVRRPHRAVDDLEVQADPFCCLAPVREFPVPAYDASYAGPRTDFRETVLWRASLRTGADGKANVPVVLSDAVTSFRVTAEGIGGGRAGRGEALVASKRPVSLAVKLPLETSSGDHLKLPVIVANETDRPYAATLTAQFGAAFAVRGGAGTTQQLQLAPNERRSLFYDVDVVGDGRDAAAEKVAIRVDAANLRDEVERTISVAPMGFPQEKSIAGTLEKTARHEIFVGDILPGTMDGNLTLYPSPLSTMVQGTEAMIAEPSGCFEQASSTTYPNIMILGYLEENRAAVPDVVEKAQKALDHGYKLLSGYETKTRGYEWFGGDPGHEALSAYGLMEFHDMQKVYGDIVDKGMIERTRTWLRGRRDGNGGFQRNPKALDSFGGASPEVTDGYIAYALSEAGETDLGAEVAKQRAVAEATKDPYLLALATKVLVAQQPKAETTRAALTKLASLQAADGSFPGAAGTITRSGGDALAIETTSLAAMALMAAGPEQMAPVRKSMEWLGNHRGGAGGFGSTQSTVLALKAMTIYAKEGRRTAASGTVVLRVNGAEVERVAYEKGHQGAIVLPLAKHLRPGKNVVELALDSTEPLPYSGLVTWASRVPAADPATAVSLSTVLASSTVKLGESAHMTVTVANKTAEGQPMTLARVGLPGGLTFQTWQLQELKDKGLIAYYETRPREVILYFRSLAPRAAVEVPLELMATVPGSFTAPASRAYLYYTAERKAWVAPTTITVAP